MGVSHLSHASKRLSNLKPDLKFFLYKLYRQTRRSLLHQSPTEFQDRIQKRWKIFWRDATDLQLLEERLSATDDLSKWKNIENWQRRLENKYNAKQFALKNGCKVAKMYWHGEMQDFEHFDLDVLPENYLIKPVFGESSKNIFLMKDGLNLFDANLYTSQSLRCEVNRLYQFYGVKEILIEEFLPNEQGHYVIPDDYKFYCFNGQILFIQQNRRTGIDKDHIIFYDKNWKLINYRVLLDNAVTIKKSYSPPKCLDEMILAVEKLSRSYRLFVRIDFYATPTGAVFGEFTATPRRGKHFTKNGSKALIKMWDRYCCGLI